MINYLWAFMIVAAVAVAILSGKSAALSEAALLSVKDAALMCLQLVGAYALWLGVLNIAKKSGLTEKIAKSLSRVIGFLFKGLKAGSRAVSYITMNIAANMLGMGNAATPFGLKAMQELQRVNPEKKTATNAMCMLLVMNATAIQLIPMSVIALRSAAGAKNPADIVITTLFASAVAAVAGIASAKLLERRKRRK